MTDLGWVDQEYLDGLSDEELAELLDEEPVMPEMPLLGYARPATRGRLLRGDYVRPIVDGPAVDDYRPTNSPEATDAHSA
ncbi:hypothetical protein [Streptomyces sp. B15]|uniref:hypothetical protein n=1 Tax=Streptomyces sp. B15 TaxID=1537797 RepID=UPI001B35927D|nr:hypothetical protein [Streptomyces sp. B15]MBQ1122609.1 hypothetical protein [Streptomyces sp. B15]